MIYIFKREGVEDRGQIKAGCQCSRIKTATACRSSPCKENPIFMELMCSLVKTEKDT